ncbi:MAG TPA: MXAN_5187 C-terminal domain-containing protein [Vicinamibacteria bacterium]|nr:MXAN_5187 C-terminal domain-containing protein [Vicinamibacteria bacterium]
MALQDDLDRLDTAIRQLQVKWDLFFNGAEKKPPAELQSQVEALVKRYSNAEIRNNGERFRYQSLSARFTSFNELWQKRLRAREEGKVFGVHGLRADQLPPPAPPPAALRTAGGSAGGPSGEIRVSDPARDTTAVRELYERFLEERRRAGETKTPPFESFRQLIGQQTTRLQAEKGAQAVDFRLETKDGKVSLKARIVK